MLIQTRESETLSLVSLSAYPEILRLALPNVCWWPYATRRKYQPLSVNIECDLVGNRRNKPIELKIFVGNIHRHC